MIEFQDFPPTQPGDVTFTDAGLDSIEGNLSRRHGYAETIGSALEMAARQGDAPDCAEDLAVFLLEQLSADKGLKSTFAGGLAQGIAQERGYARSCKHGETLDGKIYRIQSELLEGATV